MRVTIEDGVYNLVIEVKIESMLDNGKAYDTKDWYFLVPVGMRGNLVGIEDEQVTQDLKRKGVGGGEEVWWTMEWKKCTREFVSSSG